MSSVILEHFALRSNFCEMFFVFRISVCVWSNTYLIRNALNFQGDLRSPDFFAAEYLAASVLEAVGASPAKLSAFKKLFCCYGSGKLSALYSAEI